MGARQCRISLIFIARGAIPGLLLYNEGMPNSPHLELPNIFVSKGINCRRFVEADTASVVALINHAFSYQDSIKSEPRTNEEHIQKTAAKYELYVFTKGSVIIGCVYTVRRDRVLHFGLLALADEYKGTGLGKIIIESIIELAKSSYCSSVELDYVSEAYWLKEYYERYGFVETGEKEEWLSAFLVRMRKQIT